MQVLNNPVAVSFTQEQQTHTYATEGHPFGKASATETSQKTCHAFYTQKLSRKSDETILHAAQSWNIMILTLSRTDLGDMSGALSRLDTSVQANTDPKGMSIAPKYRIRIIQSRSSE